MKKLRDCHPMYSWRKQNERQSTSAYDPLQVNAEQVHRCKSCWNSGGRRGESRRLAWGAGVDPPGQGSAKEFISSEKKIIFFLRRGLAPRKKMIFFARNGAF